MSAARILGHELAHLAAGCSGTYLGGIRIPYQYLDLILGYPGDPDNDPAKKRAVAEWRNQLLSREKEWENGSASGEWLGREWKNTWKAFGDLGEYDAVINWENPIAAELGENPRFSH